MLTNLAAITSHSRSKARRLGALGLVASACAAAVSMLLLVGGAGAGTGLVFRWDIVKADFSTRPVSWSPGGEASARANDGSKITLTGSGTFGGPPENVTGGGSWTTFGADGNVTGSGTYEVKALVGFFGAPGRFPMDDRIGAVEDSRAGLAVLRIRYSDGAQGILMISTHVRGTPNSLFIGVTATKGFVAYWERLAPVPNVDGNRTLFHTR